MLVDANTNEIRLKIVYWGPGYCGRSSNLQFVHAHTDPTRRTQLMSHVTDTERLLWFSFMPQAAPIGALRVFLYTEPGGVRYASGLQLLNGADGVVFVADSQHERIESHIESMEMLDEHLQRTAPALIPLIVQYNKRDLSNAAPISALQRAFNPRGVPHVEAIASKGIGVFETLRAILDQIPAASL